MPDNKDDYQRGLLIGMAIMRDYIADFLETDSRNTSRLWQVRNLPFPKYPPGGTGVLKSEIIELRRYAESNGITIDL